MEKKITLKRAIFYIFICSSLIHINSVNSQIQPVTFTNESSKLGSKTGSWLNAAVDMNNDGLDDIVRVADTKIYIDFQNIDHSFTQKEYLVNQKTEPDNSICAGDIDNNGFNDLIFSNPTNVSFIYANNNGTSYNEVFMPDTIVTQRSNFIDINNDGNLDAFVCNDIKENSPYLNDGYGNLSLDFSLLPTKDLAGNYSSIWFDYNNDHKIDLYITKCKHGASPGDLRRTNLLYRNNGDGTFSEVGSEANMDDNRQGWTSAIGDFDNDGYMDAFIVNHDQGNRFMHNNGDGTFTDIIASTNLPVMDLNANEAIAADFNNDGWIDILAELSNSLYLNNGDGTFSVQTGVPFNHGAIGDFNNDGFLDVTLQNNMWINKPNGNHWLKVIPIGTTSNINGIGARIEIEGSFGRQVREIRSGEGYSYMSSLFAYFGIGSATSVTKMTIYWPSGTVDIINNPPIDQLITTTEGNTLNIKPEFLTDLIISPNPVNKNLTIKTNEDLAGSIVTVFDILGRRMLNEKLSSSKKINVASLKTGYYFLRIQSKGKTMKKKFMKL